MEETRQCSEIVKESKKKKREIRDHGLFERDVCTTEMELIKLALCSAAFTVSFQSAYIHLKADTGVLQKKVRRALRKSLYFKEEKCNIFFLKPEYIKNFVDFDISEV